MEGVSISLCGLIHTLCNTWHFSIQIILYSTSTLLYSTLLYSTQLYSSSTLLHSTLLYSSSTLLYSTPLHSTDDDKSPDFIMKNHQ